MFLQGKLGQGVLFLGLLWGLAPTTVCEGQIWIEWVRVTDTNLVADPSLGANDIEEKDFIAHDFDQDGDADLISARKLPFTTFGNRQNVYFENVDGVLVDATATYVPAFISQLDNSRDVRIGEFNGDIWTDFIIANAGNETSNGQQPRIFINLGVDGLGTFLGFEEQPSRLPILSSGTGNEPNSCAVAVGDLTGNGVDDIYLTDYRNDLEDTLLINNGSGFFTEESGLRLPASFVESGFTSHAEIADLNGDGFLDIIKDPVGTIRIAYNDGTGFFTTSQNLAVSAAYHFDVGDLNGDPLLDIYVVQDGQDQYKLNNSPPGTIPVNWTQSNVTNSPLTGGFGGNVHIADLDLDGDGDVVVTDVDSDVPGCNRRMAFLQSNGATPVPAITDPYGGVLEQVHEDGVYDVAVADFNGDAYPDLFVGHCNGNDLYFQVPPLPPVFAVQGLSCTQMNLDVHLSWTNPQSYDGIEVRRDGTPIASLDGTVTSYQDLAPGSGDHSYSLVASEGGVNSAPSSCVLLVSTVNPVSNLTCVQFDDDIQLSWTNNGGITGAPYDSIEVRRSGVLIDVLPGGATSFLNTAPPLGNTLYSLTATLAADLSGPTSCPLNVAPTNATDLVLDFTQDDGGTTDSALALEQALTHNSRVVNHVLLGSVTDLPGLNIEINDFERVWVELGTFPNNKVLTAPEGQMLADYVTDGIGGSDLFLSGGDTFFLDPPTAVHALLGLTASSDGFGSVANVRGLAGATCDLSSFTTVEFSGEDDFVDRLVPAGAGEAILRGNVGGNAFNAGIFVPVGDGSIISQSVEFGGIGNDHDKDDLIELFLHCMPSGFPPPVANLSGSPTSGVAPLTVTFQNLSTGFIDESVWLFGDNTALVAHDAVHTYTSPGTYTVILTVQGPGGIDGISLDAYITVHPDGVLFVRGDANLDGGVDLGDAVRVLDYLFNGQTTTDCLEAFDANDDESVDLADAIRILGYLFSQQPDLAAPFPACGIDPTQAALGCTAAACP